MANVIGISIGTRNVGIAVIRLRKLTDYRIRTFSGKWTPMKCNAIVTVVEAIIEQDDITDITLKFPDAAHCSENMHILISNIKVLATAYEVKLHCCTVHDIRWFYASKDKGNKKIMAALLVEKYPELKKRWSDKKGRFVYNSKLFEAVACAELALRAGH